jgi:hypothetical protein
MPQFLVLLFGALGLLLAAGGLLAIRASGAHPRLAQRYAGAQEQRVGDLLDLAEPPARPLRVTGRIRCADPLVTPDGDSLVAYHRDVEVRLPGGGWRTIDRLRETRSFELWDHDGSLTVDPALAAEPLVTIPHVWRGVPDELEAHFRPALDRLVGSGTPPSEARSVTRLVSTVDRIGLLAEVRRNATGITLEPPPGGFILSTLELDAAMRLLGGPRRGLLVGGYVAVVVGGLVAVGALLIGLVSAFV